jgi:hypothetical protein
MPSPVFRSPRGRRRLGYALAAAALAATGVAAVAALPAKAPTRRDTFRPGAPQVVRTPPTVPLTPARRRAINALLDTFVPAAVERRNPLRALEVVTPSFRTGVTRAQWARGDLPVHPFDARDSRFDTWRLDYSYEHEMSVDLLLHPAPTEKLGAISFTAVFKQHHGRWLIDSFVPAAIFAPEHEAPRILAEPDFTPSMTTLGSARLDARWLLVPAAVLALIVLVPVSIGVAHLRRSRRAMRRYRMG